MKKNAFTLVELLAIITVLAVILVIAVPKIINTIKDAKIGSLKSSVILLAKDAEEEYGIRDAKGTLDQVKNPIKCEDVVKKQTGLTWEIIIVENGSTDDTYDKCQIKFDKEGNATVLLNANEKSKFGKIGCVGTKSKVECDNGAMTLSKKCTIPDKLVDNLKYVDGQYTYTYNGYSGWSVVLTDKESTDPVTTELCETVNGKPIVSMYEMFRDSKAESIDTSSFDTSNVTGMGGMFQDSKATEIKGLENFDTSNVTDMGYMFSGSAATEIKGLNKFNTSNVTNMSNMFRGSKATTLDLSSFNTSEVTDMQYMFYHSAATEIKGLDKFNTSNVTNMHLMFDSSKATSLDLSSFDTSNVTDMLQMFYYSKATILDLSSFDTSNVISMGNMFSGSKATTGYARSQEDADRFNASSNKPDTLTFIVKQN